MNSNHRKSLSVLSLTAAIVFSSATAQQINKSKPESLLIQEQGSFAIGGAVTTAPGAFDPIKQGAYNPAGVDPAGQMLHGDHAYVFYQVPVNTRKLTLVFWHGQRKNGSVMPTPLTMRKNHAGRVAFQLPLHSAESSLSRTLSWTFPGCAYVTGHAETADGKLDRKGLTAGLSRKSGGL